MLLGLTRILRVEDFLQADHLSAFVSGLTNPVDRAIQIPSGIIPTGHLYQTDAYC